MVWGQGLRQNDLSDLAELALMLAWVFSIFSGHSLEPLSASSVLVATLDILAWWSALAALADLALAALALAAVLSPSQTVERAVALAWLVRGYKVNIGLEGQSGRG